MCPAMDSSPGDTEFGHLLITDSTLTTTAVQDLKAETQQSFNN
jgi:hypothetical protein